jgi:hypothetical protein
MGLAYSSSGILLGPVMMLAIALMNLHCQHLLVLGIKKIYYFLITLSFAD